MRCLKRERQAKGADEAYRTGLEAGIFERFLAGYKAGAEIARLQQQEAILLG